MVKKLKFNFLFFISLAIILFDQLTKQLVRIYSLRTTGHFLDITYTTNTGTLFSLFAGTIFINLIFIILAILALTLLFYLLKDEKLILRKISYSIIMAGIVGNLIDRILYGSVVDFINFHFWPIFNLADSALFIGIFIALLTLIREEKSNSQNSS